MYVHTTIKTPMHIYVCIYAYKNAHKRLHDAYQLKAKNATANTPASKESDKSHAEPNNATMYNA